MHQLSVFKSFPASPLLLLPSSAAAAAAAASLSPHMNLSRTSSAVPGAVQHFDTFPAHCVHRVLEVCVWCMMHAFVRPLQPARSAQRSHTTRGAAHNGLNLHLSPTYRHPVPYGKATHRTSISAHRLPCGEPLPSLLILRNKKASLRCYSSSVASSAVKKTSKLCASVDLSLQTCRLCQSPAAAAEEQSLILVGEMRAFTGREGGHRSVGYHRSRGFIFF